MIVLYTRRARRGDAAAVRDPDERLRSTSPRRSRWAACSSPTRCGSTATTATSSRGATFRTRSSISRRSSRRCSSTTTWHDARCRSPQRRGSRSLCCLRRCARRGVRAATAPKFLASDVTGATFGRDFPLTDHTGKPRTLADYPRQGRRDVLRLHAVSRRLPDDAGRARRGDEDARPRRRPRAGAVRHRRPGARHAGAAGAVRARVRSAFRRACTATPTATARTAKEFKVIYQKQPGPTPGSYTMDHSAGTFIFDPQGGCGCTSSYGQGADVFAHDIKALLHAQG